MLQLPFGLLENGAGILMRIQSNFSIIRIFYKSNVLRCKIEIRVREVPKIVDVKYLHFQILDLFCFRMLVSGSIQLTLFGAGTVYLLLSSQIIQEIMEDFFPQISFCLWLLLISAGLTPAMWLGSPKDFW